MKKYLASDREGSLALQAQLLLTSAEVKLILSPRSVLLDNARKVLNALVGVKLWPFLYNQSNGSVLKDKLQDKI